MATNLHILPEDVVVDILLKLPTKSLIRCKSVCKLWYSIIMNSSFVSMYFKVSSSRNSSSSGFSWADRKIPDEEEEMWKFPNGIYEFLLPPNSRKETMIYWDDSRKTCYRESARCLKEMNLAYCDGLYCIGCKCGKGHFIALFNPTTMEFRLLPRSNTDSPPYKSNVHFILGFGFDCKTKDYKVVKLVNLKDSYAGHILDEATYWRTDLVEVYTLGTNTWRVLDIVPHVVTVCPTSHGGTYTRGFFHWFLFDTHKVEDRFDGEEEAVVSFNLGKEEFEVTQLPERYILFDKEKLRRRKEYNASLLHDDKLTIVCSFYEEEPQQGTWFEIFSLEDSNDDGVSRWSCVRKVEPLPFVCCSLGFWNKNEILILREYRKPYGNISISAQFCCPDAPHYFRSTDSRLSLANWRGYPSLYNLDTNQVRAFQFSREVNYIYKESLMSLRGVR